jgi:CDP-glucose 4,6-dehydratase
VEALVRVTADDSHWLGRRVLITGATGLVGSALSKALLARGADVTALVRDYDRRSELFRSGTADRCTLASGAVEEYDSVERALLAGDSDTVVHLAAQPIVGTAERAPLGTFEVNVRGTYNVLEACRRHRDHVRSVVVASSDKAYGDQGDAAYLEDAPLRAVHPYDVSKACTDLLARSYALTYELPVVIARCGNVFGPGDLNWSRLIPGTIRSLALGQRPVLRSDGTLVRDYIYAADAADAYTVLAANAGRPELRGEAFNFSGGLRLTVLEVVERIRQIMKSGLEPIVENTARHEIKQQRLSTARARDVFGWRPKYGLEEGLDETVEWYARLFADARLG